MTDFHINAAERDSHKRFEMDVRRSLILSTYIRFWGMPLYRVCARHRAKQSTLEVYFFPGQDGSVISRFATIGISGHKKDGLPINKELMLALPSDLGGAKDDDVFNFTLDLASYVVSTLNNLEPPILVPETKLAPTQWKTRVLLIDQARGEPEELSEIVVGDNSVEVFWVIPIYESERQFIQGAGIEEFDSLAEKSELSLADINRPKFV